MNPMWERQQASLDRVYTLQAPIPLLAVCQEACVQGLEDVDFELDAGLADTFLRFQLRSSCRSALSCRRVWCCHICTIPMLRER
jgi:hypothetical protein